jgi:hypothetical protein
MIDLIDRLLLTAISCLLGCGLGLAAMRIKERRERISRIRSFLLSMNVMMLLLRDVLHDDPKQSAWIKTEGVFQFFDLLDEPLCQKNDVYEFLSIYSNWTRGFYYGNGLMSASCMSTKLRLETLSQSAMTRFNSTPRLLPRIYVI